MKIAYFDPSVGIKSISVKESKSAEVLPKGSIAESKGELSLALTNNFPTDQLKSLFMESCKPESHTPKATLGDRLKKLFEATKVVFSDKELLSLLQEECKKQEVLMEARQKNVGP